MNETCYDIRVAASGKTLVSVNGFTLCPGKITFLFGESGIGKSLICKAIYGLLDGSEYDISINDRSYGEYVSSPQIRSMRQQGFFVFQEPSSHLNPLQKLSEQLAEGSLAASVEERDILCHLWSTADAAQYAPLLDLYPQPYRPSGGEKQRILLAMAFKKIGLARRSSSGVPALFVFDEPTGSLDNQRRNLFLNLLFQYYGRQQFSAIIITHDYSMISEVFRSHRQFAGDVAFKELSKKDSGEVSFHDFAPEEYLSWIQNATRAKPLPDAPSVLRIKSQFRIFGRQFRICADPAFRKPADLQIRKGEMVYLKAASGIGKTTLSKAVMGLLRPEAIRFSLGGLDLSESTRPEVWKSEIWAKRAGMVFQHADEALNLQSTVREVFAGLPLKEKPPEIARKALEKLFSKSIIEALLNKKVSFLSGGQKQRINLLRTLVLNPLLLILDEPLNGLDFSSTTKVLSMLDQKRQSGTAILLVSHNEEIFDTFIDPSLIYYLSIEQT